MKDKKKTVKLTTYLAGPMDDVSIEVSRDWRDWLTEELRKMGIDILNPITKYGDKYGIIRQKFATWQKFGNIDSIRQAVSSKVIPKDLEMVKKCDFITMYITPKGHELCGTYGEATIAFENNIPVYIVTKRRLKPLTLPKWVVGCSTKIFSNWKDYLNHIKDNWVDEGNV